MDYFLNAFIVFMALMILAVGWQSVEDASYKQGQIDAINGKIVYELRESSDGSKGWVKTK